MNTITLRAESDSIKDPGLLDYLRSFEPIVKKYAPGGKSLTPRAYAAASKAESAHQFGTLTKYEYGDIAANLRLVYGDSKMIKRDIDAFYLVEKKIIHQYLGIAQLEKLYDEDYFNFEWDMHVGQNFKEHKSDYYRDHFIHEIRDMYMMLRLLDEEETGFYKASKKLLSTPETSKISEYVTKKWRQFANGCAPEQEKLLKDVVELCGVSSLEDYKQEYFFSYVIYASSIIAALFHDMGYPICHFLNVRDRVSEYNPFMYMFTHNAFESFDMLASRLSASLLFTVVSPRELHSSMRPNNKGKYNHGTYSAIALLLRFYDNGLINSLSLEQQCAIELAAVAIYNHTAGFDAIEEKKENNYYTMVFRQNPISFLLRFCDDLQEWDRRYFEVTTASDFIFCPDCGAPLLLQGKDGSVSVYRCFCSQHYKLRPNLFVKRKLYLVSVADRVSISMKEKELTATIDYDLYKLLLLSYINETYAKYRAKELYELKRLIDQNYSLQELQFHRIRLDYFMSPNPLWIKLLILKRATQNIEDKIKEICNEVKLNASYCARLTEFYHSLSRVCYGSETKLNFLNDYSVSSDAAYNDALSCLVDDCIEQSKKINDANLYAKPYIDKQNEAHLYQAVRHYTNLQSFCNQYERLQKGKYVSFFADLQVFYRIWEDAKKTKTDHNSGNG